MRINPRDFANNNEHAHASVENLMIRFTVMPEVSIKFHEDLNDLIRSEYRDVYSALHLNHRTTVKDIVESFGVPHTEIDTILVNGEPVGFCFRISDGDVIDAYPVAIDGGISRASGLQEKELLDARFIADCHLGKLVGKMRLLGLDVTYGSNITDDELANAVIEEKRVLLTRDRRLLMRAVIDRGYLVRSQNPAEQLSEVIRRFDLRRHLRPFSRCAGCNGILESTEKSVVLHLLKPKTKKYYEVFSRCESCGQVYWQGSHFAALEKFIARFTGNS